MKERDNERKEIKAIKSRSRTKIDKRKERIEKKIDKNGEGEKQLKKGEGEKQLKKEGRGKITKKGKASFYSFLTIVFSFCSVFLIDLLFSGFAQFFLTLSRANAPSPESKTESVSNPGSADFSSSGSAFTGRASYVS